MAGIKDVAKRSGVSISTVSNVINGNRYVSNELCEKVHRAIAELDYEVDLIARSLKNNKTMTIGVILTSMDRIFIPQVLSGIEHSAEKHKYNLLIYTTNDSFSKEKKYLKMLINSKVDGIIIDSVADINDEKYYNYLGNIFKGKKKIPVVSIERNLSKYSIFSVYANNILGAYEASKHLIEAGCKKIVHIGGPSNIEMVLHRTKGYKDALAEFEMESSPTYNRVGDFSPLSGYREMKRIINGGVEFDGVFADNDQMAIGAIKALRENQFKIPEQVKIAGFDNTFVSSIVRPALTTINVPKYRMGWEAAETLCELMNDDNKDIESYSLELSTNLLVRESTGGKTLENWDLEGW